MSRTLSLLRFFLSAHSKADLPLAALLIPVSASAVFALLLSDVVTPFAFALCTLCLSVALVAIPLLGELGYLLRADPASEWVESQPIKARELRTARTLHLLIVLAALTITPLLPVALLAPAEMSLAAKFGLILAGLGLASLLAAVLLLIQAVLGGRAESVFVLLQTLIVAGVILGMVLGLQHISTIAHVTSFDPESSLVFFPPAWFASAFGENPTPLLPIGLSLFAFLLLLALPRPVLPPLRRGANLMERLLMPARAMASRVWLRRDERGPFDLIYDATPREREIVLRSYPMLGIPLAFLLAASLGEASAEREGLMALLLFTPGIYLPILLSQIPASDSYQARWIIDGAPLPEGAWQNGAIKALALRFLAPLYAMLTLLAWQTATLEFALRMALPGALISLAVLRMLYSTCVPDPPLSIAPDRLQTKLDWGGSLMVLAFGLTIAAVLANQFLTPIGAAILVLCLLAAEWSGGRALRRKLG